MLLLVKNHLKDSLSKFVLKENNRPLFLFHKFFFSQTVTNESISLEEENIMKVIRNLFRLKKELNYTAIKDVGNLKQRKETETIKGRTLRNIKNLFEHEEEEKYYYKPVRGSNFWSNNYIENESNSDRNKTQSGENKTRLY